MTSEARIASLGHMQGESSAPKMSIGVLAWTDQSTNYTIMSLGAIHGRNVMRQKVSVLWTEWWKGEKVTVE